jgi:hypothetical protein
MELMGLLRVKGKEKLLDQAYIGGQSQVEQDLWVVFL